MQMTYAPFERCETWKSLSACRSMRVFSWNLSDWIARGSRSTRKIAIRYIADCNPEDEPTSFDIATAIARHPGANLFHSLGFATTS